MPANLWQQLAELEEWASENKRDAFRDTLAFWALKVPAILASATAGIWAHYGLTMISVISGALASVCVIIDGIQPRGELRNIHLRAFHDIRILTSKMVTEWRTKPSKSDSQSAARKIIGTAEAERVRIATYIRDAETALRSQQPTSKLEQD